tara:strand:+ start:168 stop:341 length:174 start_codon:yes stop_codon:yes gene_type:complete
MEFMYDFLYVVNSFLEITIKAMIIVIATKVITDLSLLKAYSVYCSDKINPKGIGRDK